MSEIGHDVRTGPDGQPSFVKVGLGRAGGQRVRDEAALLRRLAPLAVVDVISEPDPDAAAPELVLRWVGPHSLATAPGLGVDAVAEIVARVADVVDQMHALGLAHGRLTADHVLLGPDGSPVLTGLAEATEASPATRRDDVVAVAALLTELVAPLGATDPFLRRPDDARRNALLAVADRAVGEDLVAPLELAELAQAIRASAPPARGRRSQLAPPHLGRSWPRPGPLHRIRDRPTRAHRRAAGAAGVVAAVVVAVVTLTGGPARWDPPVRRPPDAVALRPGDLTRSGADAADEPADAPSSSVAPPASCRTSGGAGLPIDVDGDGCADDVEVRGRLVRVGDEVRAVGAEGDHVVVGDWDCDGRGTVVALRPSTGQVFHFSRWSALDQPVTVPALVVVSGATDLTVRPARHPGCHTLTVLRPNHSPATETLEIR